MEEIFELIKAFNRLKEKIVELIAKIDLLINSSAPLENSQCLSSTEEYVEKEEACRILHICPRTLAKLRSEASIPFIKKGKNIQYLVSDLNAYLKKIKTQSPL